MIEKIIIGGAIVFFVLGILRALIYLGFVWLIWGLFFLLIFLALLVIVLVVIWGEKQVKKKREGEEEIPPIIFNTPRMTAWIRRNVWYSNHQTLWGFSVIMPGWWFWIPKLLHSHEGFVDLMPHQRDIVVKKVNTQDGKLVEADTRMTTRVRTDKKYPVRFKLMVDNRDKLENQFVSVALNEQTTKYESEALIEGKIEGKTLEDMSKDIEVVLNGRLKEYGLKVNYFGVQKIRGPEDIMAALSRETAAKIEERAKKPEAASAKYMIEQTGASPTWVVLGQMLTDAIRGLLGGYLVKEEKEEKEEEK